MSPQCLQCLTQRRYSMHICQTMNLAKNSHRDFHLPCQLHCKFWQHFVHLSPSRTCQPPQSLECHSEHSKISHQYLGTGFNSFYEVLECALAGGGSAVWGIRSLLPTQRRVVRGKLRRAGSRELPPCGPGFGPPCPAPGC